MPPFKPIVMGVMSDKSLYQALERRTNVYEEELRKEIKFLRKENKLLRDRADRLESEYSDLKNQGNSYGDNVAQGSEEQRPQEASKKKKSIGET